MHVISLYLVLHACAAIFDMMCVKKNKGNQTGSEIEETNDTEVILRM
jgi:hypothetical protein